MSERIKMHLHSKDGIGMVVNTKVGSGVKQIYRGPDEPTNENILVWIDTKVKNKLLTKDDKEFITKDNQYFIVKEIENGTI